MKSSPVSLDVLSVKSVAASVLATYFAGVVHPLELIKTRFQSTPLAIQAMTEDPLTRILSPSMGLSRTPSQISTKAKASVDSTKASTSHSSVKPVPWLFSFGSMTSII